ncbi:MAG TPA: RluA family pseudouridine synthase [Gemmatimonadales bacterium]|nr:RluA family pseudouridine synthase [Gemmatimonadales bacterium]
MDRFLADQLDLSRTQAARIVAAGGVRVNGKPARASRVLERRDLVEVEFPEAEPRRQLAAYALPLTVVFEDEHLAVIDKPAGLVVHPAPGHWDDTLVNALVARGTALGGGVQGRPGIVHRLDRDTSGLMVIAKNDLAHRRLGAALAARQVSRAYAVLAWGHFDDSPTVISAPLARHPTDRKRMAVRSDGRPARTDVFVVARFEVCDLLRAELHSGRTHQIRAHLRHAGHPVVGDPVYGAGGARRITGQGHALAERLDRVTPRQALHAAELRFRHPVTGAGLRFTSDWPVDLQPALQLLAGQVAPVSDLAYFGFFRS